MRPRRGFTPRISGCGPRSDGACTGSGVRAPFLIALLSLHRAGRKASAREPSQPWIRPPEQLLGRSRQRAPVGASPRGSAASRQGPGLVKNDLPDTPLPAPRSRVPSPSSRLTSSTSATSTHPGLPGPLLLRPGRSPAVFLPAVHGRLLDRLRDGFEASGAHRVPLGCGSEAIVRPAQRAGAGAQRIRLRSGGPASTRSPRRPFTPAPHLGRLRRSAGGHLTRGVRCGVGGRHRGWGRGGGRCRRRRSGEVGGRWGRGQRSSGRSGRGG